MLSEHEPSVVQPEYGIDVAAVGHVEDRRLETLAFLARKPRSFAMTKQQG
jgi:hypothetical protein